MSIIMTRRRSELSILSELHQDSVAQDCKTHKRKRGALSILSELHHTVKCPLCSAMEDNFQFFLSCILWFRVLLRMGLRIFQFFLSCILIPRPDFTLQITRRLSILSELHQITVIPQWKRIIHFQFFLSCISTRERKVVQQILVSYSFNSFWAASRTQLAQSQLGNLFSLSILSELHRIFDTYT